MIVASLGKPFGLSSVERGWSRRCHPRNRYRMQPERAFDEINVFITFIFFLLHCVCALPPSTFSSLRASFGERRKDCALGAVRVIYAARAVLYREITGHRPGGWYGAKLFQLRLPTAAAAAAATPARRLGCPFLPGRRAIDETGAICFSASVRCGSPLRVSGATPFDISTFCLPIPAL